MKSSAIIIRITLNKRDCQATRKLVKSGNYNAPSPILQDCPRAGVNQAVLHRRSIHARCFYSSYETGSAGWVSRRQLVKPHRQAGEVPVARQRGGLVPARRLVVEGGQWRGRIHRRDTAVDP